MYDGLNGKVLNLVANDVQRFELALAFLHDIWKGPVEALLFGYFIYQQIGLAGVIGMAFLLSFIPIQGEFSLDKVVQRKRSNDFATCSLHW